MARPRNAERVLIAQRRARVLAMRIEHRPDAEIAAALGVSVDVVRKDFERARDGAKAELDASRATAIAIEAAKLDAMEQAAWQVLRREHIVIQHGKVVRLNRKPLVDDAPVLQAIDRLERIAARRARLLGHDAPAKVEVSAEVDAEIAAIAAALAAGVGELEPAGETEAPGDAAAG